MADLRQQDVKNHARFDPPFHFFLIPALFLNVIACVVHAVRHMAPFNIWLAVMSIVLVLMAFLIRMYPLRAQDRVIRLEERLRLTTLCGEPMRSRIYELTPRQLIALRFASDAELPSLAQRALEQQLTEKQIKEAIVNWRPDHCRI